MSGTASEHPGPRTSDERIAAAGREIQEKASLIWNVANSVFGAYKPHEYGLVILPMAVVKRFHDCLLPTRDAVLETWEKVRHMAVNDAFLRRASGYPFYNVSRFTFAGLLAEPDNVEANFRDYLNGFSPNVRDILDRMGFPAQIDRLAEAGALYQVIADFSTERARMGPDRISAVDMGYIFENLVQRFSESYNEEAGAHFTSRDIIYLMCDLLVAGDGGIFSESGAVRTVYDMAMGTSQMLTCMEERLHQLDARADVMCFGQEINPFTWAVARADMLIRGGDPERMRFGDTLDNDQFAGQAFDYCISNPPFGIDWKREAAAVEAEAARGFAGRFGPGLPGKGDGQLLFLLNGLAKLGPKGRMAIIQNGSSLFVGDAGSGPSEIRRHLVENDLLEAIIQLPTDSFYNTGIATYIWIVSRNKAAGRKGGVQLLDAGSCFEPRRRSIGSKRVDITSVCRDLIVRAYGAFEDGSWEAETDSGRTIACRSRILAAEELLHRRITVETPAAAPEAAPGSLPASLLDDAAGAGRKGRKGRPKRRVADPSRRDTEIVPLSEDVDEWFAREVLPHNPDAWIDAARTKIGCEIPFTRVFYEYAPLEPADDIAARIGERERRLAAQLRALFGEDA